MSSSKESIKIPEEVLNECFNIYNDILTFTKKQNLEKVIRHAYLAGNQASLPEEKE